MQADLYDPRRNPSGAGAGSSEATRALRDARIRVIVVEAAKRLLAGDSGIDQKLLLEHPDLLPELKEALADLQQVRMAYIAAVRAGPIKDPLPQLSAEDLERPIRSDTRKRGDWTHLDADGPAICGYRFVREIGRGGQAVVHRAVQEATGRSVAIKVMPGGPFLNSRHRARFDREVAVLANLDHPNVVGILDRGRTAGGSFFLVMPLVEGMPLDEYLFGPDGHSLPSPRHLAALMAKVADAVNEAHRCGVVHRDLKPSNVRVDSRGEPHILDFGLAHLVGPPGVAVSDRQRRDARLAVAGQIVGSLPWASPEQARGTGDEGIGVRSDVYALGVMLYQGLTGGRFPYCVDGPISEILGNILSAEPPPPSVAARTDGIVVDPALDAIVLRALAKDPGARYASAGSLTHALTEYLSGARADRRQPEGSRARGRACGGA